MIRFKFFVVLSLGMISLGRSAILQTPTLENPVNVAPRASITASSSVSEYGGFNAQKVVDGSEADYRGWVWSDSLGNYEYKSNMWLAKGVNDTDAGTLPAWLKFDFLEEYKISSVSMLNTKNHTYGDRGAKDFSLKSSSDGINYVSTGVSGKLDWQNTSFQNYDFSSFVNTRYLMIEFTSAYNLQSVGYDSVGLNEVKIIAVPEPSSLSLLALGGVFFMVGRRRKE